MYVYIYLIFFILGCAGSLLLHDISLVAAVGSYFLAAVHGLLTGVTSLAEHRLSATEAQQLWFPGSRAQAQ